MIFLIVLDAIENKKVVDARISINNIRTIESEIKIKVRQFQSNYFGKLFNRLTLKGY